LVLYYLWYVGNVPYIKWSYPRTETVWSSYKDPIIISFSHPVKKSTLTPRIKPEIKGVWVWDSWFGIDGLTKTGRFYPSQSLTSDQRFVVYISGVSRKGFNESHELGIVFNAPKVPKIIDTLPRPGAIQTSENLNIKLKLDKSLEDNQTIVLRSQILKTDNSYSIKVLNNLVYVNINEKLEPGLNYNIEVWVKEGDYLSEESSSSSNRLVKIGQINYQTKEVDGLIGVTPNGDSVKVNERIRLRFTRDVDPKSFEQKLVISPNFDYKVKWITSKQVEILRSVNLEKDTVYSIHLKNGLLYSDGTSTKSDLIHTFKTIGKVQVVDVFPLNQSANQPVKLKIKIKFDQEVDKSSAENSFFIFPKVAGKFVWYEDNTLEFIPEKQLEYRMNYTFGVKPGVISVHGLDSEKEFSYSFRTRDNLVVLNVPTCSPSSPAYCQPQYPVSFSCNVYALKMVLAWKGYNLSPRSIISEMGYDDEYDGVWKGNPNKVYVGNADGSWGYGVYWDPSKRILDSRGIRSEIVKNWSISGLAKKIEEGFPVVIWRYNGTSKVGKYTWVAKDGETVKAISGQHGGVVTGFRGSSENPTHILLNDPWFGTIWLDAITFDYYWSFLDRVGLVVY